ASEPLALRGRTRGQRESAIAHDDGGHTVPAGAAPDAIPRDLGVHVGVTVDEAWRDDQAVGVERALGRRPNPPDLDDPAVLDCDVAAIARASRAIDDGPATNHEIESHVLSF